MSDEYTIPKRISTAKPGDVYEVPLENEKAYFQYLMLDTSNMNSEVIRVFRKKYPQDEELSIDTITNDEVAFYTHIVVPAGIKLGLWRKVGNNPLGDFEIPTFRNTPDIEDEESSKKWSIWKPGEPWRFVGELTDEQRRFDTAWIITPDSLIHRIYHYPQNPPFNGALWGSRYATGGN